MKKKLKRILQGYWITLFFAITSAYFVWLTWNKLTIINGDTNLIWFITGSIVLFALVIGHFSIKKLAEKFT